MESNVSRQPNAGRHENGLRRSEFGLPYLVVWAAIGIPARQEPDDAHPGTASPKRNRCLAAAEPRWSSRLQACNLNGAENAERPSLVKVMPNAEIRDDTGFATVSVVLVG